MIDRIARYSSKVWHGTFTATCAGVAVELSLWRWRRPSRSAQHAPPDSTAVATRVTWRHSRPDDGPGGDECCEVVGDRDIMLSPSSCLLCDAARMCTVHVTWRDSRDTAQLSLRRSARWRHHTATSGSQRDSSRLRRDDGRLMRDGKARGRRRSVVFVADLWRHRTLPRSRRRWRHRCRLTYERDVITARYCVILVVGDVIVSAMSPLTSL